MHWELIYWNSDNQNNICAVIIIGTHIAVFFHFISPVWQKQTSKNVDDRMKIKKICVNVKEEKNYRCVHWINKWVKPFWFPSFRKAIFCAEKKKWQELTQTHTWMNTTAHQIISFIYTFVYFNFNSCGSVVFSSFSVFNWHSRINPRVQWYSIWV